MQRALLLAFFLLAVVPLQWCKSKDGPVALNGSGASLPAPLYAKWIEQYEATHKATPNAAKINFQPTGSGAGMRAIADRTVDFGATDTPMTDAQIEKMGAPVAQVPTTIGVIAVVYNFDAGVPLRLPADVLSDIFLGEVKVWNHAKIRAHNPDAKLPDKPISVVYRADGSGSTAIFTEYLSKTNEAWRARVGSGTSVKFPVGVGANKNDGVTMQVKETAGAVGYAELAFARQAKLPCVELRNRAGRFVAPSLESATAAAAAVAEKMDSELRVSLVDAEAEAAYPIAALSYVIVPLRGERAKSAALADFLRWALRDGQRYSEALHYAPLPPAVVARALDKIRAFDAGDAPVER